MPGPAVDLLWPKSRAEIAEIQRARKRAAVESARHAPFYRGRLDGIDLDRLDDPEVWNRIPLLTKDELRTVPAEAFHDRFCVAPRASVVEYWRSGGVTGRPLFYPRSADDMKYALLTFKRGLTVVGATRRGLRPHLVPARHPPGRASLCPRRRGLGHRHGLGRIRQQHAVGDAARADPRAQADHLVRHGQLRAAPREPGGDEGHRPRRAARSRRSWWQPSRCRPPSARSSSACGAREVFDQFGMTEGALVSCESVEHDGLHLWSDLFFVEVVDETTGVPVRRRRGRRRW